MKEIIGCGCSGVLKNTGVPTKGNKIAGVPVALLLQETYDSTGAFNHLVLDATFKTQLLADLNEKDPSKRILSLINIAEVTPDNEGAQFETMGNGARYKSREGIQTDTFTFAEEASHQLFRQVAEICVHTSIYFVDACGNILGVKYDGNKFRGRRINIYSYNAELLRPSFSEVQKLQVNFDYFDRNEQLNSWIVKADEIDLDLTKVKSMIDIYPNVSDVTATSLKITPKFNFGTALNLVPVLGLTTSEITVFNETTELAVTVTSVTEVNGVYTVNYASGVTAADVLRVEVYKAATTPNVNPLLGADTGVSA